ncbi:hypothetical protein FRC10_010871 [Ceratobasidium sp. 414]|nr:hypothetical protein FRC10_010871 [Ceratobasidium sp. 414]
MDELVDSIFYANGCSKYHFFQDGNLMIKVRQEFFLVHTGIICSYSRKIAAIVGSMPTNQTIKLIELEFRLPSIQQCLDLYTAALDYEVPDIEEFCSSYLLDYAPTSFDQLDAVEQYRRDFRLVVIVVRICRKHKFTPPLPWALYMLGVHNALSPKLSVPTQVSSNINALAQVYARKLQGLRLATVASNARWNKCILEFCGNPCVAEGWDGFENCCRRVGGAERGLGMLIDMGALDPLKCMSEALSARKKKNLCEVCGEILHGGLMECMQTLYTNICWVVNVPEVE